MYTTKITESYMDEGPKDRHDRLPKHYRKKKRRKKNIADNIYTTDAVEITQTSNKKHQIEFIYLTNI